MRNQRNLLVVIADGEHARLVRPAEDNALTTRAKLNSDAAGLRSSALGAAPPGASFHSGASVHHAIAPRHDPHQLAREKFARSVAARIEAESHENDNLELVLVAPPDVLSIVRDGLGATTKKRIIGELAKDLVKVPDHELWLHLRSWVRPTHRRPL